MPRRDSHSHWVPAGRNTWLTQKLVRLLHLHKEGLPRACFQNRAGGEQPGAAAYCWWGTTLCEASILAEFRLWDTRSQEHRFSHRQVFELTVQQNHLPAWCSPSRKSEVSWFLDPTEFHREQVRKLPPTGARFFLLRRALATTSQLCRSQECWESTGGQKTLFWGEAALMRHSAPPAYRCQQMQSLDICWCSECCPDLKSLRPELS